jgi:ferredoxin
VAYVVCEPCRDCKYTDCVVVCPCECFYQDEMQLYIDPDDCVDCDACVPECPVEAIYRDSDVPAVWVEFVQLNADRSKVLKATSAPFTEKLEAKLAPGCSGPKQRPADSHRRALHLSDSPTLWLRLKHKRIEHGLVAGGVGEAGELLRIQPDHVGLARLQVDREDAGPLVLVEARLARRLGEAFG